jgi:hypothetical protein
MKCARRWSIDDSLNDTESMASESELDQGDDDDSDDDDRCFRSKLPRLMGNLCSATPPPIRRMALLSHRSVPSTVAADCNAEIVPLKAHALHLQPSFWGTWNPAAFTAGTLDIL